MADNDLVAMQIYVLNDGARIALDVEACDTIFTVKAKIQDKQGVLPYSLTFCGAQLEDARTLSSYNIEDSDTVVSAFPICIVNAAGHPFDVVVSVWNTIFNIKAKIQNKTGIPTMQLALAFGEVELRDNHTVRYYHIQKDSTLHLAITCLCDNTFVCVACHLLSGAEESD